MMSHWKYARYVIRNKKIPNNFEPITEKYFSNSGVHSTRNLKKKHKWIKIKLNRSGGTRCCWGIKQYIDIIYFRIHQKVSTASRTRHQYCYFSFLLFWNKMFSSFILLVCFLRCMSQYISNKPIENNSTSEEITSNPFFFFIYVCHVFNKEYKNDRAIHKSNERDFSLNYHKLPHISSMI